MFHLKSLPVPCVPREKDVAAIVIVWHDKLLSRFAVNSPLGGFILNGTMQSDDMKWTLLLCMCR